MPTYARALHDLTRKDTHSSGQECEEAFTTLKQLLTEAPLLAFPDFTQPLNFILETDASGHGLGAVLSQKADGKTTHMLVGHCKVLNTTTQPLS